MEFGLYYLQSRYYDPAIGRFISADKLLVNDPSAYGCNLFVYCGNDPVNRVDPSGYLFWDALDWGFAGYSWGKFIDNPSWGNLGEALLDTVCLLPFIPSVGYVTKADDAIDLASGLLKSDLPLGQVTHYDNLDGWRVGDDIGNLTAAGNKPSWTTVQKRYWKNEAYYHPDIYSIENITRMYKGKAPLVLFDNGKKYPMELHHIIPQRHGGPNIYSNLMPLAPWEHAEVDPYRFFKP